MGGARDDGSDGDNVTGPAGAVCAAIGQADV